MKRIIILLSAFIISQSAAGENAIYPVLWAQNKQTKMVSWVVSDIFAEKPSANTLVGYHIQLSSGYWIEPLIGANIDAGTGKEMIAFKSYYTGNQYVQIWLEGGWTDVSVGLDGNWNLYGMYHYPDPVFGKFGFETALDAQQLIWGVHWVIPFREEISLVPHWQEGGRFFLDIFITL